MKLTYFHWMQHRELPDDFMESNYNIWVDPPYYDLCNDDQVADFFNWTLDEHMLAAELGFDGLVFNEHHQAPSGFMANPNLMGAVAAKLTNLKGLDDTAIVQMGQTLPTSPPVRVAEEYAMIDSISRGRLVAGVPLGTSMDVNQCYGISPLEQRERHREALDFIIDAWTRNEVFPYNGKYYQYPKVNIWPKPYQDPRPPIWLPGSGSPSTQEFCLDRNFNYGFLSTQGAEKAKGLVDQFWRKVEERGLEKNPYRLSFTQLVMPAESDAKAEELYGDHLENYFKWTSKMPGHWYALPGHLYYDDMMKTFKERARTGLYEEEEDQKPPHEMSYSELVESGAVIAGGPQTVTDRLKEAIKDLNIGNLMLALGVGSMDHELTKNSIRTFAEEIKPQIEDLWEDEWENQWWPERMREKEPEAVN